MDKTIFYAREKLAAADLNQVVTDTESFVQNTIYDLIGDKNSFLYGLDGTPHEAGIWDRVDVAPGVGYHADGRKIISDAGFALRWNGTDGVASEPLNDRIDVVAIKAQATNTATATRYFIDTNPSSVTYGQVIPQTVITNTEDSYAVVVIKGTPDAVSPTIPTIPSDYIEMAYIYIASIAHRAAEHPAEPADILNSPTHSHMGAVPWDGIHWDSAIASDVDNLDYKRGGRYFRKGAFISQGTADGGGLIIPVECPFATVKDFSLLVDTGAGVWSQISSITITTGPTTLDVITANVGIPGATYYLTVRD